ncbi:hypothetical protein F4780DRAFT_322288 [Xylariomycetidae sp. FL0641]|nr:hypothetical protein F4780DRAFT_322288 [Xylariomycetidae sp. FL0641]
MKTIFAIASVAILGAMANPSPMGMGVEVIRRDDGTTIVREVPRALNKRTCTNCVHVGGTCTIGEGNCMSSEHGSCTDCGDKGVICVDTEGGSCNAP